MKIPAERGRARTAADGCRRYLPVTFTFDTRAWMLGEEIQDNWDEAVKEQWRSNKQLLREQILHEYGVLSYDRKLADFTELGKAPWSVLAPHVEFMIDIRHSFIFGSYYSSLLGSAGLGERILNDLVLSLRDSYPGHPATQRVSNKESFNDWRIMTEALQAWGVIDDEIAAKCKKFAALRHLAVHYRKGKPLNIRQAALQVISYLGDLVNHVFAPHGGAPRYIPGTSGHSFISLGAESDPVVQNYLIPNSVLVSPDFEFGDTHDTVLDEDAYSRIHGVSDLTDSEFAERYNAGG